MPSHAVDPIHRLELELARLPTIGERSAARLATYILRHSQTGGINIAQDLATALSAVADTVQLCSECRDFCTSRRCYICADDNRAELATLCIVESVGDRRAIEATGGYSGLYHVLHGVLAPLEGIGPRQLELDKLLARCKAADIREVILATNADVEGDATALYIAQILSPLPLKVTRLASGIPLGGELEYLDQATVERALIGRLPFSCA